MQKSLAGAALSGKKSNFAVPRAPRPDRMKVAVINKSDSTGGAAVVSHRLTSALRDKGVDARMLVVERGQADEWVESYASPLADKAAFLAERAQIFACNHFSRRNLFKADSGRWGRDVTAIPWVREADVVMLNWINQGGMSLKSVDKLCSLGKPVIWTMHDMWNCTGVCHYSFDCLSYTGQCGRCKYLNSRKPSDLSRRTQMAKAKLYSRHNNITFVAVSNWLARCCRESTLMADAPLEVIHNAFPIEKFSFGRQEAGDIAAARGKKVIVSGAARLDVEVKGFEYIIETSRHIARHMPDLAKKIHIVLYGAIRDRELIDAIAVDHTYLGKLDGMAAINNVYTQADIVLSTALYENLPGTLIEGQASGCLPVTFGAGGQDDIVDHLSTGYIADYRSPQSVAEGIEWALGAGVSREALHESVRRKFSADAIADQYIDLCERMLAKCNK